LQDDRGEDEGPVRVGVDGARDEFGHYEGKPVAGNRQHDEHGDQLPVGLEQGEKPGARRLSLCTGRLRTHKKYGQFNEERFLREYQ